MIKKNHTYIIQGEKKVLIRNFEEAQFYKTCTQQNKNFIVFF